MKVYVFIPDLWPPHVLWVGEASVSLRAPCVFQPERIDPSASRQGYDVRSDVWSLGITLVRPAGNRTVSLHPAGLTGLVHRCVFAFSTSWPRDASPTPSGTVSLISWPRWWRGNLPTSATRRIGSSPPSSSTLLTSGKPHQHISWSSSVSSPLRVHMESATDLWFCPSSSLTKDESKRPKYKELLVSSWTRVYFLKKTTDTLHCVTFTMWPLPCDLYRVTCDLHLVTGDMWHAFGQVSVSVAKSHLANNSIPKLMKLTFKPF